MKTIAILFKVFSGRLTPLFQLAIVASAWGAACLDIKKPGQWQFYDPIPWQQIDGLIGDWGQCPSGNAASIPGIPMLTKFFQYPSTPDDWRQRLGKPVCQTNDGKRFVYTWHLDKFFGSSYLRIEFTDDKATGYKFLRGK